MSVYVDPIAPCICCEQWNYDFACHLIGDTAAELHAFASSIGLKRAWFQDGRLAHYDLAVNKRREAVKLGAIQLDAKTFIQKARKQRNA